MATKEPHIVRIVESGQPSRIYDYASLTSAKKGARELAKGIPKGGGYCQVHRGTRERYDEDPEYTVER